MRKRCYSDGEQQTALVKDSSNTSKSLNDISIKITCHCSAKKDFRCEKLTYQYQKETEYPKLAVSNIAKCRPPQQIGKSMEYAEVDIQIYAVTQVIPDEDVSVSASAIL